jgi:hypothetical protein
MKKIVVLILIIAGVLLSGCTSEEQTTPVTVTTQEIINQTVEVVTTIETIVPIAVPTNDERDCYNRSLEEPPEFCYDLLYWVRPTPTPPAGTGYTAKVVKNSGCINLNRTSGLCEGWGDDLFTVTIYHNLTMIKNLTELKNEDLIAAVTYYNVTNDLNMVNDILTFDGFIQEYWDGTYSPLKYNSSAFSANETEIEIPIVDKTFNPYAYNYSSTVPITTKPTPFINITPTNNIDTNITTNTTLVVNDTEEEELLETNETDVE